MRLTSRSLASAIRCKVIVAVADSGGERAAALYTLLETAKLNGLNPEAYSCFVLERIADHPNNRLADLLPWRFAQQLAQDQRLAA